jgi:hypothetical protein
VIDGAKNSTQLTQGEDDDALSLSAPMPDRKYELGSQFPADRPRLFFWLVAPPQPRLAMGRPETSRPWRFMVFVMSAAKSVDMPVSCLL